MANLTDKNRKKIKKLAVDILKDSFKHQLAKIDKALDSGAVDIGGWDENYNPAILPKCIVVAVLNSEASQLDGKGTKFEKQLKKDVKRIYLHL